MLYGERYVNYDQSHAGWYHFDENIGAMSYGFYFNSPQHKWVYYDHALRPDAVRGTADQWALV